jgi:preprotein translocase subunit SecA
MGTSRNERSPSTPNWKPALAVLGIPDVGAERQNLELWRAAYSESGALLERSLSSPLLIQACRLISQELPVRTAVKRFDSAARKERQTTFIVDLARRAFVRSSAKKESVSEFVGETFAEIVTYYASRDLPSYIGAPGRLANISDSVSLKQNLQDVTKAKVRSAGRPETNAAAWKTYVARVLATLREQGRNR